LLQVFIHIKNSILGLMTSSQATCQNLLMSKAYGVIFSMTSFFDIIGGSNLHISLFFDTEP